MSPKAGFVLQEEVVPRLKYSKHKLNPVGAEDPEELLQDATCLAAGILTSAERRGKAITASNAAYYALCITRQGRRSTGYKKNDVMHPSAQIMGHSRLVSLEDPIAGEHDSHSRVEQTTPFTCRRVWSAAWKMDWGRTTLNGLSCSN